MADDGDHETLRVGDTFPNVSCNTTHGIITSMHQHFGSSWALVVTQPEEGNAVGLTELGELERMKHEFAARKVQVYVISCADAGANEDWLRDVHSATGYSEGRDAFLQPEVETSDALRDFPRGLRSIEVPSGQDYLRLTADPRDPALNRDDLAKDGSLKFRRGSRSSLDEPDEASAEVTLDGEDDNTFS
ncbi:peroxiredoxin [Aureococcus anophagefferens]|nr:peroxiredoxin [Aureococcus anophagefferens]